MAKIPCPECGAAMSPDGRCPRCGFRLPAADAVRCRRDRGEPPPALPHSWQGVASCVVALAGFGAVELMWLFGYLPSWFPTVWCFGLMSAPLGIVLALRGLAEAARRRLFPVLGLALNGLTLLVFLGTTCFMAAVSTGWWP